MALTPAHDDSQSLLEVSTDGYQSEVNVDYIIEAEQISTNLICQQTTNPLYISLE